MNKIYVAFASVLVGTVLATLGVKNMSQNPPSFEGMVCVFSDKIPHVENNDTAIIYGRVGDCAEAELVVSPTGQRLAGYSNQWQLQEWNVTIPEVLLQEVGDCPEYAQQHPLRITFVEGELNALELDCARPTPQPTLPA